MKKILLVFLLFIAGCDSMCGVTPRQFQRAEELCKPAGGLEIIRPDLKMQARCKDGTLIVP